MFGYDKKFIIIGNLNALTYKEIFPLIKDNKIWLGATCFTGGAAYFIGSTDLYDPKKMSNPKNAYIKDGKLYWRVNGVRWFTNLDHKKRHNILESGCLYKGHEENYLKYDNYDAINVDKVNNFPEDYFGIMGVPISFLDKYCPEQFNILGLDRYTVPKEFLVGGRLAINGKPKYARILIKRKENVNEN